MFVHTGGTEAHTMLANHNAKYMHYQSVYAGLSHPTKIKVKPTKKVHNKNGCVLCIARDKIGKRNFDL